MIRANDGAAPAPQETCLRQASVQVVGQTSAASWMCTSHCSFEPDLNLAAIRIGGVCVGNAGSELATTKQAPSGAFDLGDGTVDVVGVHQPKTEMCDAAAETGRS